MPFLGFSRVVGGVERVFKLTKLHEDANFLIISIDLCNVRNVIQLSDQFLHNVTSLFFHQDLINPNFQDSIIKVL
jgi:hypothetical protein